jgi:cyclase
VRVIPVLLLDQGGLVKTIGFKNKIYIGDVVNAIKIFNDKEVDEIVVLDISASKSKSEPNYQIIKDIASECFMPLSYGGGINSLSQMSKIFSIGVEKIVLNQSLLNNRSFISKAIDLYGSQSIVASVDIKTNFFGKYKVYDYIKKKAVYLPVEKYIQHIENIGVGEILVNNVSLDGTRLGPDMQIIKKIDQETTLPIVYCGGVGSFQHIVKMVKAGIRSIGVGSYFILYGRHKAVLINYLTSEKINVLNAIKVNS